MRGEVSGSLACCWSNQFDEKPERMVEYSALLCTRFLSLPFYFHLSRSLFLITCFLSLSLQVRLLSLSLSLLSLVRISSNNTERKRVRLVTATSS